MNRPRNSDPPQLCTTRLTYPRSWPIKYTKKELFLSCLNMITNAKSKQKRDSSQLLLNNTCTPQFHRDYTAPYKMCGLSLYLHYHPCMHTLLQHAKPKHTIPVKYSTYHHHQQCKRLLIWVFKGQFYINSCKFITHITKNWSPTQYNYYT